MTMYRMRIIGEENESLLFTQQEIDSLFSAGETSPQEEISSGKVFATVVTEPENDPITYKGKPMGEEDASLLLSSGLTHVFRQALTN